MTIPVLKTHDGLTLPAVSFGTYKLNGSAGVEAMKSAIDVGYVWLDSAFNYENEGAVGKAVRDGRISRDKLIVASKLPGRHHQYDEALATIEESLYRAQLDYYDLYYIHWPNPKEGKYVEAWKALVEARRRGLVRSVAVCNFLPEHLERIIDATGEVPSVNQIELHPYFPQDAQRAWNKAHDIVTQAWSPLGRASAMLKDPVLTKIAERLGRSVPQVILRWHTQLGVVPIPKSANPERQKDNLFLFDFELTADDMAAVATLARPDGRTKNQDPSFYQEF